MAFASDHGQTTLSALSPAGWGLVTAVAASLQVPGGGDGENQEIIAPLAPLLAAWGCQIPTRRRYRRYHRSAGVRRLPWPPPRKRPAVTFLLLGLRGEGERRFWAAAAFPSPPAPPRRCWLG
ncbi:hypothetical protein Taro_025910 [Colocasia esculenta]|uniref:Uncharacterized protein n=1 Tax=Colocasia esculenta TaxID=4460 RepID=A0A843VHY8_COLES|nr:hypothetical protein [Colocasia esculenta]